MASKAVCFVNVLSAAVGTWYILFTWDYAKMVPQTVSQAAAADIFNISYGLMNSSA